jgi:hypothetical protein
MKLTRTIVAMFVVLFLSACREEMSPLVAGSVSYKAQGGAWAEKPLTQQQLQALSSWLARSSSNWGRCFITPPGSTLSVSLKHANGSSSSISQLNFSNSQTTLMASHLSGSNLSEQPCALQSFTEADIESLHQLLEVPR